MSRKRSSRKMEYMPLDVVEKILERLPVKSLLRFKAASKEWRSTIESPELKERHDSLVVETSSDPDVLMVSLRHGDVIIPGVKSLVLGGGGGDSSSLSKMPAPWDSYPFAATTPKSCRGLPEGFSVCHNSFDGLVCLFSFFRTGYLVNPSTGWYCPIHLSSLQTVISELGKTYFSRIDPTVYNLAFGKDDITGKYKLVWLYNSSEIGSPYPTRCEVYDFTSICWRFVKPRCPFRINGCYYPVCVDGSIYWLTKCQDYTKVVSFNLHTETFQVAAKAPFTNLDRLQINMSKLDNRLCVSEMKWPNQVIWSFDANNQTWHKLCCIDLFTTSLWFGTHSSALQPLLLFGGKKKNKLLFYCRSSRQALAVYDLQTNSYDILYSAESIGRPICYFPSFVSGPRDLLEKLL
ncbi:unnamed protein product [Cochlearia groenlandica]